MGKLLILGSGGHGRVVAEAAFLMKKWSEISFLDDDKEKFKKDTCVIGSLNEYRNLSSEYSEAFVSIGNVDLRLKWINKLMEHGYKVPTIIHPFSFVSKESVIKKGSIIMAGVVVNNGAKIKKGCIINTSSSVDHDCVLDIGVHISPGAHVGGTTFIGKKSWICTGASISNNINIGKNSIIASGASVISDVQDNVMVAGVPAKVKKHRS